MKHLRSILKASKTRGRRALFFSMALLTPMWLVHALDAALLPGTLARYGLRPRDLDAGWGILAAPLLHANLPHLAANSLGLFLLGGLVAAVGRREWVLVTALGWLGGGLGVWILGRPAVHIGASGLVYAFLGFLLLRGWYQRNLGSIALSATIYWAFGEALTGMIPFTTDPAISWEGHLFGFISGVAAAALLRRPPSSTSSARRAPISPQQTEHTPHVDRRPTAPLRAR